MKVRELGGLQGVIASYFADEKYMFKLGLARAANREIWNALKHVNKISFNVLSTDCGDDNVIKKIITCNSRVNAGYAYVTNKLGEMDKVPLASLEEGEFDRMCKESRRLREDLRYQTFRSNREFESEVCILILLQK